MKRLLMTTIASLMIAGSFSLPAFAQQGRGGHSGQQGVTADQNDRGDRGQRAERGARPGQPHGGVELQGQPGQNRNGRPGQPQTSQYQTQQFQGRQAETQSRGGDYNRSEDHTRAFAENRSRGWSDAQRRNERSWGEDRRWQRHDWRRGERLGDWNDRYYEVDYRDYRLERPPYGYRWVRDDNGDFLLAALAGGLIAAIIANN